MNGPRAVRDAPARRCLRALALTLDPATGNAGADCDVLEPAHRHALELSGEAVVVVDTHRRILYFNQRASELTGFAPEEVVGQTCTDGLRCSNCLESCTLFEDGDFCQRHLELETADGRRVYVVKSGRLLLDRKGRVVGGIETLHDVSDLHAQREAQLGEALQLEIERDLLKAFAVNVEAGIAVTDRHGRIRSLSARAAELLGVREEGARGTDLVSLVDEDAGVLEIALAEVLATGQRQDVLGVRARGASRSSPRLMARVSGLVASDGQVLGAAVVLRRERAVERSCAFLGLIGGSQAMRRLYCQIRALACTDASVLIRGESGSGKEMVARALHEASNRADRPFHAVNCAALSEDLVESELFGHERGAFTGAIREKPGRLELAADGTLLLDEVGCLPLAMQAKLLRVLEAHEFERVGGTRTLRFRARVISATNADLESLVSAGAFREDLYYRLKVLPLVVPPLRERREDVPLLVEHFAASTREGDGEPGADEPFTAAALLALTAYDWPGNVRELRSAVQFALAVSAGRPVDVCDLPPEVRAAVRGATRDRAENEKVRIERTLHDVRFNRSDAATLLGMSRTTLWRKMRRYGLG